MRQLSDKHFYQNLPYNPIGEYQKELKTLITQFPQPYRDTLTKLIPDSPEPGIFYLLPKIHKLREKIPTNVTDWVTYAKEHNISPPGRPIVSCRGTLTEHLSAFVDSFLQPLLPKIRSYIKDTTQFLQKLSEIETVSLSNDCLLVTLDVSSLYTNIPHLDGIKACERFLVGENIARPLVSKLCSLMKFILSHNNFSFEGEHYVQAHGTAMGTKMAPAYACLFMATLEEDFLEGRAHRPVLYLRFIDDIFMIWDQGEAELINFIRDLNNAHGSIKFTHHFSPTSLPFLDVLVSLRDSSIHTSVYCKPTDRHAYLQYTSFHPNHIKESIVYSQALRLKRICADPTDFRAKLSELKLRFLDRGYPLRLINAICRKTNKFPREQLLQYKSKVNYDRIPFVTTYFPQCRRLFRHFKSLWPTLQSGPHPTPACFNYQPVLALKQPPSLSSLLVSSSLPPLNPPPPGNLPCNRPRCQICKHLITDTVVTPPGTNIKLYPGPFNCNSSNVVYLFYCDKCSNGNYVGETKTPFRLRFNNHKQTIRSKSKHHTISLHFNLPDHGLENLHCCLLRGGFKSDSERKSYELKLIIKLNTLDHGLNRERSHLGAFNCLR
ncbi:hypothetical protein HOLleu_08171 [Holothuria leucospilota]|uniref:Reverse transcriptase domain-containing protein n=1 Tax=Holothuria leucospilota TaxID=206669 RepID=A0A9Q1CH60_HOLLE|nr:hypothetical protein HOLleu_08171 [Holothuria leucospilota]